MFVDFKILIKNFLLLCFKPTRLKYLLYTFLVFLFSIYSFFYFDKFIFKYVIPIGSLILYELFFRVVYKQHHKKGLPEKFPLKSKDIPIEEHPYLPWVYKKNYNPPPHKKIHGDDRAGYMLGGMKTNNIRHVNGYDGGRDVEIPKPSSLFRVICLGDSTTCNYIYKKDGSLISWPLKLEEKLHATIKNRKIEVNNCGVGGYNTNEVLIKFLIDTIDTEPDMVIFYHAFANVRGYLTPGFQRDFFHFRRTISSAYPRRVVLANYFPDFGLWSLRYLIGEYFSYLNVKEDHIRMINRNNTIDKDQEPAGLEIFQRNIETLIDVCKGRGIQLILSTYCYHLYKEIKNSEIHKKFYDTVMKENKIITDLASKYSIPLVDNQKLIPADSHNFIDEVHPTEAGMDVMAENFFTAIAPIITRDHK